MVIFLNESNRIHRPNKTMLDQHFPTLTYQFMLSISVDIKYKIHFISQAWRKEGLPLGTTSNEAAKMFDATLTQVCLLKFQKLNQL